MIGPSQQKANVRTEKELMNSILGHHLTEGSAIGLWRLPQSSTKNLIVGTDGPINLSEVVLEELDAGFLFSPFDPDKEKIFIKADLQYVIENGELDRNQSNPGSWEDEKPESDLNTKEQIKFFRNNLTVDETSGHSEYLNLVAKSIDAIQEGYLEKIVPSRSKKIQLPEKVDILESFNTLCSRYPNAFVSLVSSAQTGTWMGASPELLVSVDKNMHFKTAAVAGTQALPENEDLKLVAWTQKEIEEQALVSRYIINCFKKIRLREFDEHGPKTWKAGNLLHLKTDFEVDMQATNFPQLGSVMLKLLHPTSAVCGMPREASINFLKNHENLDRSFYSGFLGPVNFQQETYLFVNLRCMQWGIEEAVLYAGAGVTLESNPEKEWEETEMKMNTLLKVFGS